MRYPHGDELPPEQELANRKAIRLEWISLAYWLTAIVAIYFALGQSQAMKAAWVEDILALFPPIAFLVASRFRHRDPSGRFPWGYHRSITVAYVVATTALFGLGLFIVIDSVEKLIGGHHPPIGMVEIFDWQVWGGWVMLAALAYSGIPPVILGRLKQPLAQQLHDKVLFADAKMNRADWLTAGGAAVGVIGIGVGLWWADAVAAIVIGIDIVHDGQRYMRESLSDLMDEHPKTYDEAKPHPVVEQIKLELASVPWIEESAVRMREHGHLLTGEVWLVPSGNEAGLTERLERLGERLHELDWRVHDVALAPVTSLEDVPSGLLVRRGNAHPD
jgi:cation diffusion facilitator family transporter